MWALSGERIGPCPTSEGGQPRWTPVAEIGPRLAAIVGSLPTQIRRVIAVEHVADGHNHGVTSVVARSLVE